jgi:hypothetical protein
MADTSTTTVESVLEDLVDLGGLNACTETYNLLDLLGLGLSAVQGVFAAQDLWSLLLGPLQTVAADCGLDDALITIPLPQWVKDLQEQVDYWKDQYEELLAGLPGGPPPAAAPSDPVQTLLDQISTAINAAEEKLNLQNFIIAAGTVSTALKVEAGPTTADTTITLNITPNPYGPAPES